MISNTCGRAGGGVVCCGGSLVGRGVDVGEGDVGGRVGDDVGAIVDVAVMLGAGGGVERRGEWLLLPQAASNEPMASAGSTVVILVMGRYLQPGQAWFELAEASRNLGAGFDYFARDSPPRMTTSDIRLECRSRSRGARMIPTHQL
jgi:hypothetical protein